MIFLFGSIGSVLFLSYQSEEIQSEEIQSEEIQSEEIQSEEIQSDPVKIIKTDDAGILQSKTVLTRLNTTSLFQVYVNEDAYTIDSEGMKSYSSWVLELEPKNYEIYEEIHNISNAAVIYPIFTAAAYSEPGFYTYYRGECDQEFHGVLFRDDDCLSVKVSTSYEINFVSSGSGANVLWLLGYDIITDIDVHKNPDILLKYEKIILLHNEYVTSEEFNAITSHPNVVYLYPNALYAEISFDEESRTISLIRGHNYPEITIRNGFDWEFDNSSDEYDVLCNDMNFSKIDNGWMLNCYPENIMHMDKELLKQIREF